MKSVSHWEEIYARGEQINRWPFSDLVSMYFRNIDYLSSTEIGNVLDVLELGFGTGPNIPFWNSLDVNYFGIELSSTAVEIAKGFFPSLSKKMIQGDFGKITTFVNTLDIICDRAAVTHLSESEIVKTLDNTFYALKRGGLYFGIDWFSMRHTDYLLPSNEVDDYTKTNFAKGQFKNVGKVHFTNEDNLRELFCKFEVLDLSEKVVSRRLENDLVHEIATWNIVARRPL